MKAWALENIRNSEAGMSLVFADTRNEAKRQAYIDNSCRYQSDLMPESWVDIRAVRAEYADGMENEPEAAIVKRLEDNGWEFWEE